MAYAAIANDGVRMRPRLVDGIYVDDKNFQPASGAGRWKPSQETARNLRGTPCSTSRTWTEPLKRARIEGYNVGQDRHRPQGEAHGRLF